MSDFTLPIRQSIYSGKYNSASKKWKDEHLFQDFEHIFNPIFRNYLEVPKNKKIKDKLMPEINSFKETYLRKLHFSQTNNCQHHIFFEENALIIEPIVPKSPGLSFEELKFCLHLYYYILSENPFDTNTPLSFFKMMFKTDYSNPQNFKRRQVDEIKDHIQNLKQISILFDPLLVDSFHRDLNPAVDRLVNRAYKIVFD